MAEAGVWLVAEIGGGGAYLPEDVIPMIGWARKYGMKISTHIGPSSIPGSSPVFSDIALAHAPDKYAHINGGSVLAHGQISNASLMNEINLLMQNLFMWAIRRWRDKICRYMADKGQLDKIVFGSDTPTGQGANPNCIQRMTMRMAAFNDVPPAQAIAMARVILLIYLV
jgi:enamidase